MSFKTFLKNCLKYHDYSVNVVMILVMVFEWYVFMSEAMGRSIELV